MMTHHNFFLLPFQAHRRRRALASALIAASLLATVPLPAAAADPGGGEGSELFRNGERIYRIDLAQLEELWSS